MVLNAVSCLCCTEYEHSKHVYFQKLNMVVAVKAIHFSYTLSARWLSIACPRNCLTIVLFQRVLNAKKEREKKYTGVQFIVSLMLTEITMHTF